VLNPAMLAETEIVALVVPEGGNTVSQFPPLVVEAPAVQLIAEPSELATVRVWLLGLLPPGDPTNDRVAGETFKAGPTLNVTALLVPAEVVTVTLRTPGDADEAIVNVVVT
jgi:hypothetical protein